MPQKTPLHDRHVELGGRIVDFHGWLLPVQYEGVLSEHEHCRTQAALFDTSHMGQFLLRGDAARIASAMTQDASTLRVGRGRYGFLLDEQAGILDDTILMRLGENEFLLVVNAGPAGNDWKLLQDRIGRDVELENRSQSGAAKLDLQGPAAGEILRPHSDADLGELGYFHVTRTKVCGVACVLSRTGYTGELGYEIFADAEAVETIFVELAGEPRVQPAGLGARDSLRLEMCYPLYGQDIDRETNPVEADLGFFLKGEHEYVGSDAIRKLKDDGPERLLVAMRSGLRRRAQSGDEIFHDDRPVGHVTSAAFAPSLSVSAAMGYVESGLARPGVPLTIRSRRAEIPVEVASKPLYERGTCRTKHPTQGA